MLLTGKKSMKMVVCWWNSKYIVTDWWLTQKSVADKGFYKNVADLWWIDFKELLNDGESVSGLKLVSKCDLNGSVVQC